MTHDVRTTRTAAEPGSRSSSRTHDPAVTGEDVRPGTRSYALTGADAGGAPVGVVGAGTMGAGIALVAALAGHPLLLLDAEPARTRATVDRLRATLSRLAERGHLTAARAEATAGRLHPVDGLPALADCAVVIEAVVERLDVKQTLLCAVEDAVGPGCLLATNTSSLSVAQLAASLREPARLVGLHFFNPADRMPLVEVVHAPGTDPGAVDVAAALARAWGKVAVRVADSPGFVVNRVARPFYGEGLLAVEERAVDAPTVDAVLRECAGFRLGPLELTDLIGQDVNLAVTTSVWNTLGRDPRFAPSRVQQRLVAAGNLGRKTSRGFYRYSGTPPTAEGPAPARVQALAPPGHVVVHGDWGPWAALWERVAATGVEVRHGEETAVGDGTRRGPGTVDGRPGAGAALSAHALLPAGGLLVPTDGRTAAELTAAHGRPVAVLDLVLDAGRAERFALATPGAGGPGLPAGTCAAEAIGLLQATGAAVTVVADRPGLLVARTLAQLVDEAVDTVARGIATADDVEAAVLHGVGYPLGLLEWGDRIGPARIVALLSHLARAHPGGRYRVSPALEGAASAGRPLREL